MKNRLVVVGSYAQSLVNFRWDLIVAAKKAGCDVYVMAPEKDVDIAKKFSEIDVHYVSYFLRRTGMNPIYDIFSLFSLLYHFMRIKPDFALFYTAKPVIYGLLASFLAGVKNRYALVTGLGYSFTDDSGTRGIVGKIVKLLYAFSLKWSGKTFFQNPDDESFFKVHKILNEHANSFVVNGSGIDLSKFQKSAVAIADKHIVFLMIARLLGDKGTREYVAAAKRIKHKYPFVDCQLVGWIDDNPDAIKQTELDEWIKEGYVNYLGKLSDVRPVIEQSSVYVLPSYREGTPRTVLEAMAMGRPIITTDAPGCRETVVDGDNGFLIPVKSVDELVNAMEKFIVQPQLASIMGERSRQIAELKYDVHRVNIVMLQQMGMVSK